MKRLLQNLLGLAAFAVLATQIISCKDDDPDPEVISGFSFQVNADNFKEVAFTNASTNFSKLEWNFGDNSATSSEENPTHAYQETGVYTVVLTATSLNGSVTDVSQQEITISDPNALLTALVGDASKTWKMLRQVSSNSSAYPLTVGELNPDGTRKGIWWRFGKDEDLGKRPCFLNDEYTFTRAGLAFSRDLKGDFYAGDGGIYKSVANGGVEFTCATVGAAETNTSKDGADLSAWHNPFSGTFVLTNGSKPTLEVKGLGAYIALEKVATKKEVKAPESSVVYEISKLYDAENGTDTLVLVENYNFDSDPEMDAYWQFILVSYDNPASEPAMPLPKPVAKFTATIAGNTLTTTNTSTNGTTYSWDFGDGTTSTDASPQHTYTDDGIYNVKLTATNTQGSHTSGAQMFVANGSTPDLTDALLQGAAWKVRADVNSLFVGPGLGKNDWFVVSKADLESSTAWGCLANDEFTFSSGGVYSYDTKGDARNDGYMDGFSNGCLTDAELATVTNDGAKFKTEADHSYSFTPASGGNKAQITVTNGGTNGAVAFLGFYKPYNGGENGDKTKPAHSGATSVTYEVMGYAKNSTKEYLFISIDYSAAQDGSSAWSFVLVR